MQVLYGGDLIDPITMCPGHDKKTKMQKDILATRMAGRAQGKQEQNDKYRPEEGGYARTKAMFTFSLTQSLTRPIPGRKNYGSCVIPSQLTLISNVTRGNQGID